MKIYSSIKIIATALICTSGMFAANVSAEIINLGDLPLASESHWNGSDATGYFQSNGVVFYNEYNPTYSSYSGFAYSNTTTYNKGDGLANEFTAITKGGLDKNGQISAGATYGICYVPGPGYSQFDDLPMIDVSASSVVLNTMYISNTAYTVDVIENGNAYAKKFEAGDWLKLNIIAYDENMTELGTTEFYLADFRDGKTEIVTDWTGVDVSSTSSAAKYYRFTMDGSDSGAWGLNTPSYFALGGFDTTAIPEPAECAVIFGAFIFAAALYYRRK